jgi:pimeloyl-ACP methyl ester carboxylesterase
MRYYEWGDPHNKHVLVCVHGLTRNGRDFDYVAEHLEDAYRVVAVDIVGRGRSDWLRDPTDYNYPVYLGDLTTLIAKLGVETVDWLGTSMGGILGMIMASLPNTPVRKLVLNDVGCLIPQVAIERIGQYVGKSPSFDTFEAMEAVVRSVSPFGELTPEQWHHVTVHGAKQDERGRWTFRYDPGIAKNFHAAPAKEVDLRPFWNAFHGPALVIRGESSDLLPVSVLDEMRRRPHTETLIVPNCGHAPMLMDDFQAGAIRRFLLG